MPDLPPVVSDATEWFIAQIGQMRRGRGASKAKPHKLVMLLAVLDLASDGLLSENKIYFAEPLLTRFDKYFALAKDNGDWNQPAPRSFIFVPPAFGFTKSDWDENGLIPDLQLRVGAQNVSLRTLNMPILMTGPLWQFTIRLLGRRLMISS